MCSPNTTETHCTFHFPYTVLKLRNRLEDRRQYKKESKMCFLSENDSQGEKKKRRSIIREMMRSWRTRAAWESLSDAETLRDWGEKRNWVLALALTCFIALKGQIFIARLLK